MTQRFYIYKYEEAFLEFLGFSNAPFALWKNLQGEMNTTFCC